MVEKESLRWIKSIRHMHEHWGVSYRYLLWISVRNIFRSREDKIFGGRMTYMESLFTDAAYAWHLSLDVYLCKYGTCSIMWDSVKNRNTGGFGGAGCKCDSEKEPRDLKRGIVVKGLRLP